MKKIKYVLTLLIVIAITVFALSATVYADTNGSEVQIIDKPGQLVLQLGPQWAGVKFQLKTDAGVFPVPVVVGADGVLRMEIGGSVTYILSCIDTGSVIPGPDDEAPVAETTTSSGSSGSEPKQKDNGVPMWILVVFLGGLTVATGGLFALRRFKRSRDSYDYYDEDNGEDDFDDEFDD